jgi:hypothetical protein
MRPLLAKVRPTSGFARAVHYALLAILPIIVFVLVRIQLPWVALGVILLSKWRMLAVKPRFWPANIRANSVDIIVGLALLGCMVNTDIQTWQIVWTVVYIVWLTFIKPSSSTFMIAVQALIGLLGGLGVLFLFGDDWLAIYLVLGGGLVCYVSAHHFFDAFSEAYTRLLSYMWGFFGAGLIWVCTHWLLYYPVNGLISQPMLLLLVIGYGLAAIYYLDHTERLSPSVRNYFIFIMSAITLVILYFSDWGDKIV